MQRRGLLGVLAFVLALLGGVLIFFYVRGADARALAGQQPAPVLVVIQEVPAGTPVSQLSDYVEERQFPRVSIVAGSVSRLDQLTQANVASTSLKVGEQVLTARFVPPGSNEVTAPVPIPEGLQLLAVQLDPQRVAGSQLTAGDKVGIFVSMKVREEGKQQEIALTDLIANDVLVARVQGAPSSDGAPAAASEHLPGSEVIVTLAVNAPLAERIVFGKEFGTLWLSKQTPTTDSAGIEIIHTGNVLE